jgi:hypothetical protein
MPKMIPPAILAVLALVALASNAEARQRHKAAGLHPDCNVTMPCVAPYASTPAQARVTRGRYVARQMGIGAARETRAVRAPRARRAVSYETPAPSIVRAVSGIIAPLAAKVAEIQSACGSKVISGLRHTNIAGTRILSLHASGKAVDLAGNPSCIYAMLHGWAGGYSTDYARMRHVHLSYDPDGGREMGVRFVHGGGHRRHAHRRHQRYARR